MEGVALKGGEGTLWIAIVAVFVLGVLSNGMQLINLGTYPQYIAKGITTAISTVICPLSSRAVLLAKPRATRFITPIRAPPSCRRSTT